MKKIGIYLITNNVNGKKYVGQSRNLIKRWGQHKSESRKDRPGIITKEYIMAHSKYTNILQFSKDGRFIKKWDLISDIEKELHINHWGIYACLNGQLKTSGGFIWRCI